jgi:hypothetical protein
MLHLVRFKAIKDLIEIGLWVGELQRRTGQRISATKASEREHRVDAVSLLACVLLGVAGTCRQSVSQWICGCVCSCRTRHRVPS